MIGFVKTTCSNPQELQFRGEDLDWPHFLVVFVVVTLYWFLATEIRYDNDDQVAITLVFSFEFFLLLYSLYLFAIVCSELRRADLCIYRYFSMVKKAGSVNLRHK